MNNIVLSKRTKILGLFFLVLVLLSVSSLFYKYMVAEDYEVFVKFDENNNLVNMDE